MYSKKKEKQNKPQMEYQLVYYANENSMFVCGFVCTSIYIIQEHKMIDVMRMLAYVLPL